MRSTFFQRRLAAAMLAVWTGLAPAIAGAQTLQQGQVASAITASTTETVNLMVGDIFEILPSSNIQNPSYSWILTQDRTFMQAGRAPTFRVRLVQPGTYTLIAEIDSPDMSQRITRTFTINAQPRPLGKVQSSESSSSMSGTLIMTASGTALVSTDPLTNPKQVVILGNDQQLVKLTPINPDLKPLALDVDTTVDSNGDGNPANDVDDQDTFFQNYASPLYVWFASPITSRTMSVTTVANGGAVVQNITVDTLAYAQQSGQAVSPVSVTATKTNDSTFAFMPQFVDPQIPQSTLLYHWNFGDGQESLLMNPSHTYASSGTYAVHLQVSDLVNGSQIAVADTQVTVTSVLTGTGTNAQTSSTTSSTAAKPAGGGLSASLGSLLWLVLIFIIFVVVGLIVTFIISKLRRGRPLDETFAELEKNIVGKESDEKKIPEPLTITPTGKPIPTQADVVKREESRTPPNPAAQTPRVEEAAAPSWLRKGLASQPASDTQTQTAAKPVTPPMPVTPKPETPAPQPKPAPQPTPKQTPVPRPQQMQPTPRPTPAAAPQPTTTQSAPVPAWLQPQTTSPSAQTSAPQPMPSQPKQTAAPRPATPTTTPVSAPRQEAPSEPKSPPTPKPATPPMPVTPLKPTMPASSGAPIAPQSAAPAVTQTTTPPPPSKPTPSPAAAPKPATSSTPVAPKQTTVETEPKPAPIIQPVTQPNTPAPQPPEPTSTMQPSVVTPSTQRTPAPEPKPAAQPTEPSSPKAESPAPQQIIPPPPQPVKPAEPAQTDAPIAIIRADSIEEQKKEEPNSNA